MHLSCPHPLRALDIALPARWVLAVLIASAAACGGSGGPDASDGGDAAVRDASDDRDATTSAPRSDGGEDASEPDADAGAEPQGDGSIDAGDTDGATSAGDGGPGDTGADGGDEPDAAEPPAPTCYDAHSGVLFCDGFEDEALAVWSRHSQGPDGITTRTTALTHQGLGALDSKKLGAGSSDPVYFDGLGERTSGHLYLRAYLRVPSGFAIAPAGSRASVLVLGEDSGALGGLSLVLWPTELSLQINGQAMSDVKGAYALPRDAWLCVQIDFEIAAAGNARLRINGQTIATGMRNTLMATHYERLWLGVNWIAPEQVDDVHVLYDDVFVGTEDIPCD
jgi:hypothetical protein